MFTTQATSTNSRGGLAVAQPPEDGGKQVIGHDEENAAAADAHIAGRQVHRLGRGLHQHGDGPGEAHQPHKENGGEQGEDNGGAADDGADLLRALFPQIPGDEDGDPIAS